MKTISMEVKLTYDDEIMHSGEGDLDAKNWFYHTVLSGELELLEKSEVGDTIGKVEVVTFEGAP